MRIFKIICIAALIAVAGVVIYQNTAVMNLTFLFWSVFMTIVLMVVAVFFAGVFAGLLYSLWKDRRRVTHGAPGLAKQFQ